MFSRYFSFLVLCGLLLSGSLLGQSRNYNWRLRLGAGLMPYRGDLTQQLPEDWLSYQALPQEAQPWGVQLGLERRLSATWSLALSGQYGYITGTDRLTDRQGNLQTDAPNFDRSLNFRSQIAGGQLLLNFRFANGWLLSQRAKVAPYLFAGVGLRCAHHLHPQLRRRAPWFFFGGSQPGRGLGRGCAQQKPTLPGGSHW